MNFIEYNSQIRESLPRLVLTTNYVSGKQDIDYQGRELQELRRSINKIEHVPFINNEITGLKESWLFQSSADSQFITSAQKGEVEKIINVLRIKLSTLSEIAESSKLLDAKDVLLVQIPEIQSFDNLQKYANDFKKAIEIPILEPNINGSVTIVGADQGSVILYIALGTIAGVKLVAGICWAAAVIKKKQAEAEIFEAHARTLNLKNEALEDFVSAQRTQLKNILTAEAEAIALKEYNHKEPETIERLKLSITTVSDLIDRGVSILPSSQDDDIQKSFPDYKNLNLIESTIKQITQN